MTAETVAGLLAASAANRPDRPLLLDPAGEALAVTDVATLSAAATQSIDQLGQGSEIRFSRTDLRRK